MIRSDHRTDEMIKAVCTSLIEVVPDFMDFPLNIQQSLVRNGVLQEFEAGRTIIRQNHKAENFYFIISGISERSIYSLSFIYALHIKFVCVFIKRP